MQTRRSVQDMETVARITHDMEKLQQRIDEQLQEKNNQMLHRNSGPRSSPKLKSPAKLHKKLAQQSASKISKLSVTGGSINKQEGKPSKQVQKQTKTSIKDIREKLKQDINQLSQREFEELQSATRNHKHDLIKASPTKSGIHGESVKKVDTKAKVQIETAKKSPSVDHNEEQQEEEKTKRDSYTIIVKPK